MQRFQGTFSDPALIYVNVKWCPHCVKAKPALQKAAQMMGSVVSTYSVDADEHPEVAAKLNARSFPTILYKQGSKIKKYEGARSADEIVGWVCMQSSKLGFCKK